MILDWIIRAYKIVMAKKQTLEEKVKIEFCNCRYKADCMALLVKKYRKELQGTGTLDHKRLTLITIWVHFIAVSMTQSF